MLMQGLVFSSSRFLIYSLNVKNVPCSLHDHSVFSIEVYYICINDQKIRVFSLLLSELIDECRSSLPGSPRKKRRSKRVWQGDWIIPDAGPKGHRPLKRRGRGLQATGIFSFAPSKKREISLVWLDTQYSPPLFSSEMAEETCRSGCTPLLRLAGRLNYIRVAGHKVDVPETNRGLDKAAGCSFAPPR